MLCTTREHNMELKLYMNELEGLSESEMIERVASEFSIKKETLLGFEFMIADINYEDYSGNAYFLIKDRETGSLFEVSGSHCSCMGFEDQWELSPTTLTYLTSKHYAYANRHPELTLWLNKVFNIVLADSIVGLN